jgi:serine/threonine protein kinase
VSALHAIDKGANFGPYRVLSRLASGGMADVWLAETSTVGQPTRLVLKTMRPEIASSAELTSMFVDEARVAAQLKHENVARVLDVGDVGGHSYIAMEFVHGRSLRQIAQYHHRQQERIEPCFLLRVALSVCDALEYLHEYTDEEGWKLGLVHGDVSPENVMVAFNGAVKLVDFGIARASASVRPAEESGATNLVIGKSWYMAPEQVLGGSMDHRVDLYSLAVVIYEFITGYRPYSGSSEAEVLAKVLEGAAAPPEEIARGISEELSATILRAMSRERDLRFQTARELGDELRARILEIDATAFERPLDTHMVQIFGEADTIASAVRRTISEKARRDSAVPTAPSDPEVVAAAIAQVADVPPPPSTPSVPASAPPPSGSGQFRAVSASHMPDIFGRAPSGPVARSPFDSGGRPHRRAPGWTVAIGERERSEGQREATRLFERGLSCVAERDYAGALELWRRAVELDPAERSYQINLKRLEERLRDDA